MERMKSTCVTTVLVAFALVATLPSARAGAPVNLVVNGDFETGTFVGWTVINSGSPGGWSINNGTFVPPGPGGALPPISGNFDAVSFEIGPGVRTIKQIITVPTGVFSAKLSWNDRVRNFDGVFADLRTEWRVRFLDTLGTEVAEPFSTLPGDPLIQVGPNARAVDVTGLLKSRGGQNLVLSFEEQDSFFFFNATLDDVKLLVSVLPTDKDECKDGGWETFVNVNTGQQIFKNQGDCVSFVATKGKNPPANGINYQ